MIVIFLERLCNYVSLAKRPDFNEGMRVSLDIQSLYIFVVSQGYIYIPVY